MLLPSLRKRREDIPLLVDHLVAKFNRMQGKDIAGVSIEVMARLMEHDFPGNVRELENIIEQAFVLCRGRIIEMHHLPPELRSRVHEGVVAGLRPGGKFVLEAYTPGQLSLNTGGPPSAEMMMDLESLKRELAPLEFEHAAELQREVYEGRYHHGPGAVVQIVATRE